MFDENFGRPLHFVVEVAHILYEQINAVVKRRIFVPMAAVNKGELMDDLGAKSDFDAFDSIEYQNPKRSVKEVNIENLVESSARPKRVVRVLVVLKRVGIGSQPVITDIGKVVSSLGMIGNEQSPVFEESDLVGNRQGRFSVSHRQ